MARNADTLAGLAALAGAAYLYKNQKDKDSNPTRAARPGSIETRKNEDPTADKETKRRILETITTPKEKSNDAAGNQGVLDSNSSSVTEPDDKKSGATSVANVKNANTTPAKPVVKRQDRTTMYGTKSGVMGGATLPPASAASTSASPAPVKRSREEAQAVIDQHKIDAAAERKKRLALQLGAKPYTPVKPSKLPVETAPEGSEKIRRDSNADAIALSNPERAKIFNPRSMVDQIRAQRDADNAKKIADMKRKTESFANPQPDMEDQIRNTMGSTMRRGGAVKMASGGSTSKSSASSRGDGIASKGKTRGRIC